MQSHLSISLHSDLLGTHAWANGGQGSPSHSRAGVRGAGGPCGQAVVCHGAAQQAGNHALQWRCNNTLTIMMVAWGGSAPTPDHAG